MKVQKGLKSPASALVRKNLDTLDKTRVETLLQMMWRVDHEKESRENMFMASRYVVQKLRDSLGLHERKALSLESSVHSSTSSRKTRSASLFHATGI